MKIRHESHGSQSVTMEGNAIIHYPKGQFNKAGVMHQVDLVLELIETNKKPHWYYIEAPSKDAHMTDEALTMLGLCYQELAKIGCHGVVLVQTSALQVMYVSKACQHSGLSFLASTSTVEEALELVNKR
ncbi:hypothetical protein M9194_09885 [Vibrio sp. S4M6]|uniref:hypothetical protein n=1 Tax=Vibrio sinus TaxID=2946865 RepID=UPI00202A47C0|nr:hypothetical protein [Vibrio sinus]MCL9781735.1 hypothetical protein [Vibrio sinus]